MWGRSGFGQEYDVSTPTGALSALPTGLVYLLFAPFPWAISGLRQVLAVPETLVWYALMPAFVRGLAFAVKRQLRAVLPILVFAVSLTAAYALMQGNVGTAYRQRTQITMFFFIFMGVGLAERRRQREERAAMAAPARVAAASVTDPLDGVATALAGVHVHREQPGWRLLARVSWGCPLPQPACSRCIADSTCAYAGAIAEPRRREGRGPRFRRRRGLRLVRSSRARPELRPASTTAAGPSGVRRGECSRVRAA